MSTTATPARRGRPPMDLAPALAVIAGLESGFTRAQVMEATSLSQPTVGRMIAEGYLKALKDRTQTGQRGRPVFRYTLAMKGRNVAKRAKADPEPIAEPAVA